MKWIIIFLVLIMPMMSWASKGKINKQNKIDMTWYEYRATINLNWKETESVSQKCQKSTSSPANAIKYGNRDVKEILTSSDGIPLVVDVSLFDYKPSNLISRQMLTRYIRGESFCEKVRAMHESGELTQKNLDRFK